MKDDFKEELGFHPDDISLQLTKPSWAGRAILYVIIIMITFLVGWSYFSEVDVVSSSRGKIIPSSRAQEMKSFVSANVGNVFVKDGDLVEKGELLVEFDKRDIEKDIDKSSFNLDTLQQNTFKIDLILSELSLLMELVYKSKIAASDISYEMRSESQTFINLYQSKYREYTRNIELIETEISIVKNEVDKGKEVLPLLKKKNDSFMKLSGKGMTDIVGTYQHAESYINMKYQIKGQEKNIIKLNKQKSALILERDTYFLDLISNYSKEYNQYSAEINQIKSDLEKLNLSLRHYQIHSNKKGYVSEVSAYNVGSLIQSGEVVMKIIPFNDDIFAEIMILNTDRGYVSKGDRVNIKLDSYDFTKFGTVNGELINIFEDSVVNEQLGEVFPALVKISKDDISNFEKSIDLGMTLTADVAIGKRTVLDFLISPMKKGFDETVQMK